MKEINIKNLVKPSVRGLRAYEAKDIPCRVKLDANESPYGFERYIPIALKAVKTNRYPDPEAKGLKRLLGKRLSVMPEDILLGNGSDELIYSLVTTFGGPVLYPVPTFSMYGVISQALGEKAIAIPLDKEFDIDLDRTLKAIRKEKPKVIFLSSPNNPTGNCFSSERILKIIDSSLVTRYPSLIVLDEAYQPFSSEKGFLPLLKDYKNLVIMRTLSKIGFAALRLGLIVADEEIINEVNKVRLPFNVNSFSQALAVEALKDRKALDSCIKSVVNERDRLFREMERIKGVDVFPSEANFILFRVKDAASVYERLLKKAVLVRNMNSTVKGCLRVTVGTPQENAEFFKALKQILA